MEAELSISSPAFAHNGDIPVQYSADGENISPPLTISGVSGDAKSLVLVVDDPDAATDPNGPGMVYDHWVVFSIPVDTTEIPAGNIPAGAVRGKNSDGTNTYIGPAPPTGTHRYFFRLYELSAPLQLDETATKENVQTALKPILLGYAELIGKYQRVKGKDV